MSNPATTSADAAKAVGITAPRTAESFDSTATGTYSPAAAAPPPPAIEAYFWLDWTDAASVPAEDTQDLIGTVIYNTPVAGMWEADFAFPAGMSGSHGFLRIIKNPGLTTQAVSESRNLTWPLTSLSAPARPDLRRATATAAAPTPQVRIQQPANGTEVARFFLVFGEFNSGDGNTVSVRLLRPDDTEAVATILPAQYPYGIQWVTAILSYEGGIGYRVQARLIDKNGNALPTPHSAGIAID